MSPCLYSESLIGTLNNDSLILFQFLPSLNRNQNSFKPKEARFTNLWKVLLSYMVRSKCFQERGLNTMRITKLLG